LCVQRCNFCSVKALSVKELQRLLSDRGVAYEDCFDKQDLIARAKATDAITATNETGATTSGQQSGPTPRSREQLVDNGCTMAERGDYNEALVNFRQALTLDIEEHGPNSVGAADNHFNIAAASSLLWTIVPPTELNPENEIPVLEQALYHIKECIRIRPVEHASTAQAHAQAFDILYATAKLREAQLKQAVQQSLSGATDMLVQDIKKDAQQCLNHAQKGVLIYLKSVGEKHDLLIDARVKAAMANALCWEVTAVADFKAAAIDHLESALANCIGLHGKIHDDTRQIEGLLMSMRASSTE
jgi:tetratricopeptide (TPR) repeat protein